MVVLRVLNVAEKPSVARAVSEILSRGSMRTREGRSVYNKIFEFEYTIVNQRCFMSVTSVTGHLMELDFEERYKKWHSCDPADLYEAPVRKFVPQDKLPLKRTLEEEARKCQWLVLWLDCDREGENIAFEVLDICHSTNPRLTIWRARFSALIDRDIHQAAQNLVRPNPLFADAVDARQEIDLRIGASFTRFQTMLLSDSFVFPFQENDKKLVLSYGPCQFPTLGFVVERYWEIQAHQPEDFWSISCQYSSEDGNATFNWARGRLFDHLSALVIYEMCVEEPTATVIEVKGKECKKFPPHPLNTVELQKRASRYFRMSSEQTMKVAEELYQAGFISYPRTETDYFSENTDLQGIVQGQSQHSVWGWYAQRLLDPTTNLWRQPSNGGHDDKAHPPIHPTKFTQGESNWSNDHARLYELITRHFLACVSQPAVGYGTTASVDIAGECFTASGLMITAKNYLEVYRFESWGSSTIPNFELGQQFIPTRLTLDMGTTSPPPLLSEADLISLMDQSGIGTDATMHDHIKKLLDRCYVVKDANTRFSPTRLGEALVMGYDIMGYELWKPYLRAMMERDMKAVSDGTKTKLEVLETSLRQMRECFLDAKMHKEKLLEAMQLFFERTNRPVDERNFGGMVRSCPSCQEGNMILRRNPGGKWMVGCMKFPHCRNAIWLPNALVEASVLDEACSTCGPGAVHLIHFKFRQGEIPPQYDTEYTGCVGGCDAILRELIEICGTGGGGQPSNSRGLNNARQGENRNSAQDRRSNLQTQTGVANRVLNTGLRNNVRQGERHVERRAAQDRRQNQHTQPDVVMCHCKEICSLLTSQTESNRGKRFYRCANNNCNFFLWELQSETTENADRANRIANNITRTTTLNRGVTGSSRAGRANKRGRGRQNTVGRGAFVRATGETSINGSCFVCGETSHWANNCPNRNL